MCYPLFSQRPGIGTCGLSLVIQCCSMWRVRWLWRARPGGPASLRCIRPAGLRPAGPQACIRPAGLQACLRPSKPASASHLWPASANNWPSTHWWQTVSHQRHQACFQEEAFRTCCQEYACGQEAQGRGSGLPKSGIHCLRGQVYEVDSDDDSAVGEEATSLSLCLPSFHAG